MPSKMVRVRVRDEWTGFAAISSPWGLYLAADHTVPAAGIDWSPWQPEWM